MSTADQGPERSRRRRRWPISIVNTVIYGLGVLFGIALIVGGEAAPGIVIIVVSVIGVLASAWARRRGAGDLERVNALEYADERDRAAGGKALAAVGVTALIVSMAQFMVAALIDERVFVLVSAVQVLLLAIVWLIANWFFVRRG